MSHGIPPLASGRDNNFNILRLLFAVLVLLSHAPELIDGNRSRELLTQAFGSISFGDFAVDGFFILSGFLIVRSWRSEPRALNFMRKRALRIYPGFWVATLVCAFVVGPLGADARHYFEQLSVPRLFLGMAILGLPVIPPVFQGQPVPRVNGAMWTISLEFICYFLVMLLGVWRAIERRKIWLILTVAWGLVFAHQRYGDLTPWPMKGVPYEFPIFRLMYAFFVGGCFELYREKVVFNRALKLIMLAIFLAGMFSHRACELILPVAGGYLLLAIAFDQAPWLASFRALPDISYGVYLYGWPVQKLLWWYWPATSPWLVFAWTCAACVPLGWLSWHWVERPSLRFRRA